MAKDGIKQFEIIVIGGSAGSFEVILQLVSQLKPGFTIPILIVVHRKNDFANAMVTLLKSKTKLAVKEAEDKERIEAATIYIAPSDYHLLVEKDKILSLDASEKVNYSRPSIDVTFQCAAEVYGNKAACILLSGANADGAEGLKDVKDNSGFTIVQDPATAEVSFMPQQAINMMEVDLVANVHELAAWFNNLII